MSDTQMIEERLRGFLADPDDADWQEVLRRAGESPTPPAPPLFTRRRLALTLAICVAVAVPGAVLSGLFGTSHTAAPQNHLRPAPRGGSRPMGFNSMLLNITRDGGAIASIGVTVNAPIRDATTLLQVITGSPYGHIVSPATRRIVFQEQEPMTNIASPASGPNGTVALSTWSGTLSPSDWTGGCQHALYEVYATTVPSGSSFDNPPSGSMESGSQWFTCNGN